MSALDSLFGSIRRVILMESKIQDLADGLKEVSRRVDHEGRLIRIETLVEMAQRRPPPRLGMERVAAWVATSQSRATRNLSALPMTLTEESAIAAAAITGDSRMPKKG